MSDTMRRVRCDCKAKPSKGVVENSRDVEPKQMTVQAGSIMVVNVNVKCTLRLSLLGPRVISLSAVKSYL